MRRLSLVLVIVTLAGALAQPALGGSGAPTTSAPSQQEYTENVPSAGSGSSGGGGPLIPILIGLSATAVLVVTGGTAWRIRRRRAN